jgi:hypothetical protein
VSAGDRRRDRLSHHSLTSPPRTRYSDTERARGGGVKTAGTFARDSLRPPACPPIRPPCKAAGERQPVRSRHRSRAWPPGSARMCSRSYPSRALPLQIASLRTLDTHGPVMLRAARNVPGRRQSVPPSYRSRAGAPAEYAQCQPCARDQFSASAGSPTRETWPILRARRENA